MNLLLLQDRILVKELEKNKQYGMITAVDPTFSDRIKRGQVVFTGPGRLSKKGFIKKPECQIGDIIWYYGNAGEFVEIDNEEYLITEESNVLAFEFGEETNIPERV